MKSFAIIGLSTFGQELAIQLYKLGCDVLVVDRNKDKVQAIGKKVTTAVIADALHKEVLEKLDLSKMDGVMVCTGTQPNTSTLITLFLKELGVKNIMVKALDDDHSKILNMVGANQIINPELDMAVRLAQTLHSPNFIEYVQISPEYNIVEVAPPYEFIGKTIVDIDLRKKYNINIIGIRDVMTEKMTVVLSPTYKLKDSDVLIVIGMEKDLKKLKTDK